MNDYQIFATGVAVSTMMIGTANFGLIVKVHLKWKNNNIDHGCMQPLLVEHGKMQFQSQVFLRR